MLKLLGIGSTAGLSGCAELAESTDNAPNSSPTDGESRPTDIESPMPTNSKTKHHLYVANRTDRAECVRVVVAEGTSDPVEVLDGAYRVDAGVTLQFRHVLDEPNTQIAVETDRHSRYETLWSPGDCPTEGSNFRNAAVLINEEGVDSVVDNCDVIYAGPFDERRDASDAEACDRQ